MVGLASLGALGLVSTCAYAKTTITEQSRQFRLAVSAGGYERGGVAPTEDQVVERMTALALEHHVSVRDVSVTTEEYTGFAGALSGQAIGQAMSNTLNIRSRRYSVAGYVRASKWLWSTEQPIESSFSVRLEVTMAPSVEQQNAARQLREIQSDSELPQRGM